MYIAKYWACVHSHALLSPSSTHDSLSVGLGHLRLLLRIPCTGFLPLGECLPRNGERLIRRSEEDVPQHGAPVVVVELRVVLPVVLFEGPVPVTI